MGTSFTIVGDCRVITGANGKYDGKVADKFVRYGRNAVDNLRSSEAEFQKSFTEDKFDASALPKGFLDSDVDAYLKKSFEGDDNKEIPMNYRYKYSPDGQVNPQALLGAAYEELGATSVPVAQVTKNVQQNVSERLKPKATAASLDINGDGKIDVGEYATSMLVADMLTTNPDFGGLTRKNATGEISNEGITASLAFFNSDNLEVSKNIFTAIHKDWNLTEEQAKFVSNRNNLIR